MSVNRYECGMTNAPTEYQSPTMHQDANGGYVSYEDYAALEARCAALAAEISRRDAIFVPVYPDENTMNRMTDVFHDTAKIYCDEDSVFVENAELVITAIINNYIKSRDAFLAEVRVQAKADGVQEYADSFRHSASKIREFHGDTIRARALLHEASNADEFAAQLRKGSATEERQSFLSDEDRQAFVKAFTKGAAQ